MIFGIDVRHRICKIDRQWMDYVNTKNKIKIFREDDDEKNPEILDKLDKVYRLLDEIEHLKREDMKIEVDKFEKDFIEEIKNNKSWYGLE